MQLVFPYDRIEPEALARMQTSLRGFPSNGLGYELLQELAEQLTKDLASKRAIWLPLETAEPEQVLGMQSAFSTGASEFVTFDPPMIFAAAFCQTLLAYTWDVIADAEAAENAASLN